MKIIILNSKLREGLMKVERSILESGNLPVLKNVLLKTYNNKIKIAATNLEIGTTCFVFGKILEEGLITIPFLTLYKIITNLDTERVSLETNKNILIVKTDSYEAKIQGMPADDFPIIPKIKDETVSIIIKTPVLKDALSQILSAAQISEIRPEISGVLIDYQVSIIKLVATDTFRLAEKTLNNQMFKSNIEEGIKAITPLKTISEVLRIFPDDGDIKISFDKNQILFATEDIELISRLIDGNYPDYEAIIPKDIETKLVIPKEQFINALKLVSSFSGRVNEIKVRLENDKKLIEVYAASQLVGENGYQIPVKVSGKGFSELAFNWRYLLDGLKTIQGDEVFFGINNDVKPAVIKKPEDTSHLYILMPIKA